GLVMLLPHGYEGQGPEHSSGRPERYKQLCAEHNIQLCFPTTPAQMFHMLRRQHVRPYRKPLIVMSPKSLLRHKLSTSTLEDLTDGAFQTVIPEQDPLNESDVVRVVCCTGKVYFDLLETRRSRGIRDVAILRVEQVYPFPKDEFGAQLERYPNARELVWCQEEPQNQGVWDLFKHRLHAFQERGLRVSFAGRAAASSPAVGDFALHVHQQETLVNEALSGIVNPSMNRKATL
ncbi:MAG: 2-oxoglutarate dehydrogenase E1 component, partial [Chromatiales bacterium]|nr:2-oxoglutarate dehydrogenase E1 component [Chromatiales bacterium]